MRSSAARSTAWTAPEWPAIRRIPPDLQGQAWSISAAATAGFAAARANRAQPACWGWTSRKNAGKSAGDDRDAGIAYRRQDLAQLQLPPESYDLVYSSLTLHYLEDLAALFATVYAALKPGGQFIFTAEHPIYTAPAQQGWLTDGNGQKSWPVNGYQREGQRGFQLAGGRCHQSSTRTLGGYINPLAQQGFYHPAFERMGPQRAVNCR